MSGDNTRNSARIIHLCGDIDEDISLEVIDSLTQMSFESPTKEISLYINSEGGDMYSMFAMHDMMKQIPTPIHTIGIGKVMSAATLLLAAGDKRSIMPNAFVMLHEPSYFGPENKVAQLEREVEHLQVLRKRMYELLSVYTGQPMKKIHKDLEGQDRYLSAEGALEYGLADSIITSKKLALTAAKTEPAKKTTKATRSKSTTKMPTRKTKRSR